MLTLSQLDMVLTLPQLGIVLTLSELDMALAPAVTYAGVLPSRCAGIDAPTC